MGPATVKQILDAAVKSPGSAAAFGYFPAPASRYGTGTTSISAFYAKYNNPVESKSSGYRYGPGEFFLPEVLGSRSISSVWQYYMFDAEKKVLGLKSIPSSDATVPTGGVFDYFDTADAIVPDGGALVWRLVQLLTDENKVPPFDASKLIVTSPPPSLAKA